MHRILEILENNADLSAKDIATMLDADVSEVEAAILQYKKEGIILGKRTVINWQKTDREYVTAMIELKVSPQFGKGFDEIAERCYQYEQVKNVFLMSGGYDLALTVEGRTLTDVALFVAEKLAPMDQVLSTATHFVLKKYKEDGIMLEGQHKDERRVMMF
jgi:DNA-binding Lrp family transcriptional regulator